MTAQHRLYVCLLAGLLSSASYCLFVVQMAPGSDARLPSPPPSAPFVQPTIRQPGDVSPTTAQQTSPTNVAPPGTDMSTSARSLTPDNADSQPPLLQRPPAVPLLPLHLVAADQQRPARAATVRTQLPSADRSMPQQQQQQSSRSQQQQPEQRKSVSARTAMVSFVPVPGSGAGTIPTLVLPPADVPREEHSAAAVAAASATADAATTETVMDAVSVNETDSAPPPPQQQQPEVRMLEPQHEPLPLAVTAAQQSPVPPSPQPGHVPEHSTLPQPEDYIKFLAEGSMLLKYHFGDGRPELRYVFVDLTGSVPSLRWRAKRSGRFITTRSLPLDSLQLLYGPQTDAFTRRTHFISAPWRCFSLVSRKRTLDLQAETDKELEGWVLGLQQLPFPPPTETGSTRRTGHADASPLRVCA